MKKWMLILISFLVAVFILTNCSTKKPLRTRKPATFLYDKAEALFKKKKYEDAVPYYEDLRNTYPASEYAVIANLKLGHSYFLDKQYIEAIDAYENFKLLYPTHKEIPLVIYRIGLSYYKQAPKAIDRDQTQLKKALQTFKELIEIFPDKKEAKEAKTYLKDTEIRIAKRIIYIGNFYYKRKEYDAALNRYKQCVTYYSGLGLDDEVYFRIAKTYYKQKKFKEAKEVSNQLIKRFPDSKFFDNAEDLIEDLN